MDEQAITELEEFVDRHGLRSTLAMLANVCAEKVEHPQTNWQDEQSAKNWNKAYKVILKAHDALPM
jgi:hypothetical protein